MSFLSGVPVVGGLFDTLTGEPTAVTKYNMSQADQQAFNASPEQQRLIDYLTAQAYQSPQQQIGPSAAEAMLNQRTQANIQGASGMLGSARGLQNVGMIARESARQGANLNQQAAGEAATLRADEIQKQKEFGLAQQQQQLQKQSLAAQQQELNRQAAMGRSQLQADIGLGNAAAETGAAQSARQAQTQLIAGLGQAGATLGAAGITGAATKAAAASDINVKENISDGSGTTESVLDAISRDPASFPRQIRDPETGEVRQLRLDDPITFGAGKPSSFLDTLNPYEYNYKEPSKNGSGKRLGVMAQDLEKTPQGKGMVVNTKEGKKINTDVSTLLAAEAQNHQRLKNLENIVAQTTQGSLGPIARTQTAPMPVAQTAQAGLGPVARTVAPSSPVMRTQTSPYSDKGLTRSYYEGGEEKLRVPTKEYSRFGLEPNTGEIVERGMPFVKGTSRFEPTQEEITKTRSFIDLLDQMEKTKDPFKNYKMKKTISK